MSRRRFLQYAAALPLLCSGFIPSARAAFRSPPAVPVPWIKRYLEVYGPAIEGPTGACHACAATVAQQAVSLNVMNAPGPPLSWPYGYLLDTGDTTFRTGSNALRTAAFRTAGVCTDALYSQASVLSHWQSGFPYPAEYLPSPQARADAPNHRLTQSGYEHLAFGTPFGDPPNMSRINDLLLAGYPICFGYGTHAGCLLEVGPDRYWYSGFDPSQSDNTYGLGWGVRPYTADTLYQSGTNFVVYAEVVNTGTAAPPSQQPLIDRIRADAARLTDPPTRQQRDALQVDLDLLVVP